MCHPRVLTGRVGWPADWGLPEGACVRDGYLYDAPLSVGDVSATEYKPQYMLCSWCGKCSSYPPTDPCNMYKSTVAAENARVAKIKEELQNG